MFGEWGPAPIDSYDLYAMGLRPARCNGCKYAQLKHELGDKFLSMKTDNGWIGVYELDAESVAGQSEPYEHEGRSIRHRVSFMAIGHSDECYHWQPRRISATKEKRDQLNWLQRLWRWIRKT